MTDRNGIAGPLPGAFMDPAWWHVYGARLRDGHPDWPDVPEDRNLWARWSRALLEQRRDQQEWVNRVAMAYRLVRREDTLSPAQIAAQRQMLAQYGSEFLATWPYQANYPDVSIEPSRTRGNQSVALLRCNTCKAVFRAFLTTPVGIVMEWANGHECK